MKRLSKIDESVWADMHKRSNGKQTRKEDDPNILDAQGFVEYLRDLYKNVDTDFYIFKDLNDVITVPMFETELGTKSTWFIQYDCTDNSVLIWDHFLNKDDKLFDKIRRKYNVKKYHIHRNFTDNFLITPKTGKSSNKFFIEIINFLLENTNVFFTRILVKNDNMNESVWADIHRRSNGSMFRKEDLPEQNPEHWWAIIALPQAPKYTKEQLRGLDIAYEFVINKIRKITKDDWPEKVDIYFKNEHYWRLQIEHITPYGSDIYSLNVNGGRSYTPITWAKMTLGEKRGIRYRLENKTFYLYKYNLYGSKKGYILREDPEYEGEKGILLK